jgi:hypothetical protein
MLWIIFGFNKEGGKKQVTGKVLFNEEGVCNKRLEQSNE